MTTRRSMSSPGTRHLIPWINYLGNKDFFSIISNTAGGYSFYRDARLRRLTRFRYNNVPLDDGGKYFYINDNGSVWSPGWKPVKAEVENYSCRHGMGYTVIGSEKDNLQGRDALLRARRGHLRSAACHPPQHREASKALPPLFICRVVLLECP